MASICRFMPHKEGGGLKTVNFVSECEFARLRQPFFKTTFVLHLITQGSGVLCVNEKSFELQKGSVFLAFPGYLYTVSATEDFEYCYISFIGSDAPSLLSSRKITMDEPVFYGFSSLIPFWKSAILRADDKNANTLTESVLLYTLSFIGTSGENERKKGAFADISDYVDAHFQDADFCLKKVASAFGYTEKYLSALFKKNMQIGFSQYAEKLRMQYARELMDGGMRSVFQISSLCGYADALYFSKVFRKKYGVSPREYMKKQIRD